MTGFTACLMGPAKTFSIVANLSIPNAPTDTAVLDSNLRTGVMGVASEDSYHCEDTQYVTIPLTDEQAQDVANFEGILAFRFDPDAKDIPVLSFDEVVNDKRTRFECQVQSALSGCKFEMRLTDRQYGDFLKAGGFAIK